MDERTEVAAGIPFTWRVPPFPVTTLTLAPFLVMDGTCAATSPTQARVAVKPPRTFIVLSNAESSQSTELCDNSTVCCSKARECWCGYFCSIRLNTVSRTRHLRRTEQPTLGLRYRY